MSTTICPRTQVSNRLSESIVEPSGNGSKPLFAAVRSRSEARTGLKDVISIRAFRILIVDDNHDLAQRLSHLIRLRGHTVQCAYTGVAALKRAHAFQPEVVLVNTVLPDLSGYEVAALLPAIVNVAEVSVASFASVDRLEDHYLSQAAGCVSHLKQPVRIAEFEALLNRCCSSLDSGLE